MKFLLDNHNLSRFLLLHTKKLLYIQIFNTSFIIKPLLIKVILMNICEI